MEQQLREARPVCTVLGSGTIDKLMLLQGEETILAVIQREMLPGTTHWEYATADGSPPEYESVEGRAVPVIFYRVNGANPE